MDFAASLAALGMHNEKITIKVSPAEWMKWQTCMASLRQFDATFGPCSTSLEMHAMSGIVLRVEVEQKPKPRFCQFDRCIKPEGHMGQHEHA